VLKAKAQVQLLSPRVCGCDCVMLRVRGERVRGEGRGGEGRGRGGTPDSEMTSGILLKLGFGIVEARLGWPGACKKNEKLAVLHFFGKLAVLHSSPS
jgi:hypothetical protein